MKNRLTFLVNHLVRRRFPFLLAEYLNYNYIPVYGSIHIFSATKDNWFAICFHINAPLRSLNDDELCPNTHNADLQKVELARVEMSLVQLTGFDPCCESASRQVLDRNQNQPRRCGLGIFSLQHIREDVLQPWLARCYEILPIISP